MDKLKLPFSKIEESYVEAFKIAKKQNNIES